MVLIRVDPAILEFGDKYLEIACILESVAGGDGPYGDQKIFFDSWAGEEKALPEIYHRSISGTIRELAKKSGEARDEASRLKYIGLLNLRRREFAGMVENVMAREGVFSLIRDLEDIALKIEDPIKQQTRIDQVNGLNALTLVLYHDIGFSGYCPTFPQIVETMTGISPPMIPTREEIDKKRDEISSLLFKRRYEPHFGRQYTAEEGFMDQLSAWRKDLGLLSKEQMLGAYQKGVIKLIKAIKGKTTGFPEEAEVKVVTPSMTGTDRFIGGSFDYGRGGPYKAESRIVPDDTSTLIDVATTIAHEIGSHYRLSVLWDQYQRLCGGDKFAATGTMCSNIAITHEGLTSQGTKIYEKELVEIYGDKIMQDVVIAQKLEELAVAMLPFEINRKYHLQDITPGKMIAEFIAYGVTEGRSRRRTAGIFEPSRRPVTLTYSGVAYGQGSEFMGHLIDRYGPKIVLEGCTEPISLAALSKSLENAGGK